MTDKIQEMIQETKAKIKSDMEILELYKKELAQLVEGRSADLFMFGRNSMDAYNSTYEEIQNSYQKIRELEYLLED